ncbi:FecCD family ABC transporter permease [Mucisphaera calidilacus]|uniref:Hemin transport system permease protein HmuU n=1 Tax=Mucisphaera calidilacus TaxID=2527982 RepID=A0A518BXV5_9BACT|nr:iron ABC transporter permease [Mucisphaera calidilacus]QDU71788.1 Hemin transport system permease protein HmuU [Mucisphaera calidilacus]
MSEGGLTGRWWLLAAVLAVSLLARVLVGSSAFGWPGEVSILEARLDVALVALVVGGALGLSGVGLQVLLRNPLAEPYLLGLASGAALGVLAAGLIETRTGVVLGPRALAAAVGAGLAMAVVMAAGRRGGVLDPLTLLLTGVVVSTVCGALLMLMNHLAGPGPLRDDLARWVMGYLDAWVPRGRVLLLGGVVLAVGVRMWWQAARLDIATLSESEARSLGVGLGALRVELFVVSAVLAGLAVVLAGPVAFVGLVAPHLSRLLVGYGHRSLVPAAALVGAVLILMADTTSAGLACVGYDLGHGVGTLPIGIFTALIGGPLFVVLLRRSGGMTGETG